MKLYFGSFSSIISTLLIIGILIYIGTTIKKQSGIKTRGKKVVLLVLWGLLIYIFAAARDEYDHSVQAAMNSKVLPGLFTVNSIQSILYSLGGTVIAFCSLSSICVFRMHPDSLSG